VPPLRLAAGILTLLIPCLTVEPVAAWGLDVHRLLTGRAVDALPASLRPILAAERAFVVEHAADPDLWRIVELRDAIGSEDPNHFLNIDALDEPAPFTGVPRDWAAFVARYGRARATRAGRLPWRAEEIYGRLVAAFREMEKGAGYATLDAQYLSAVLAHYVQDAFVPFHAVGNYNGQLTGQHGIHARFETELPRRAGTTALSRTTVRPIGPIGDFIFDTLVASQSLAASILEADRRAAGARGGEYDDGYFEAFLRDVRPTLERRMSEAASATAGAIAAAWREAGSPRLPDARPAAAPAPRPR
jgi:hypothetical protein